MTEREMIAAWMSERERIHAGWLTHLYCHLIINGIAPNDAIRALSAFVDEVILKRRIRADL